MEELRNLPFYSISDYELIGLCETAEKHFNNLLESKDIREYVCKRTVTDENFNFEYYSEDKINSKFKALEKTIWLAVFHVNIRSLNHNHHKLELYLESLNMMFDIIVVSEIWAYNMDFYENIMNGYTLVYDLPKCRNVGGGNFCTE